MFKHIFYSLICIGAFIGLNACTEELSMPANNVKLVKESQIYTHSNGEQIPFLIDSRSSQPNSNQWGTDEENGKYKDYPKPEDITDEEREKVLAVFNEIGKESYEPLVDWSNFFVQQVYCGPEGNKMTELATIVDYEIKIDVKSWWPYEADTTYVSVTPFYDIVNDFNNGACSGNAEQGCMLMFNSSTKQWSFKSTQGGGERFDVNWRMEWIDGAYYVGFDFQSNKQGSESNGNELFERDYIYNDWIIKIVPAVGVDTSTPPSRPSGDNNQTITPPAVIKEHVEVNLSIEDKDNYLVSHLSIHVRAATDVEVYISLPIKYYCEVDDMVIVEKHVDNLMVYGGPRVISYNINNNIVTLTVSFETNGIRITTDGINEDVISFLKEKNGDGLTFEIWNYMNIPSSEKEFIEIEELKYYLNQSTIEFLDKTPDLYVNAFNKTKDGFRFEDDCIVDIVNKQLPEFKDAETDNWYNGSPFNKLYYKK